MSGRTSEHRKKKRTFLWLIVLVLVIALICLLVFGRSFLGHLNRKIKYAGSDEHYTFDAHTANDYAAFDGGLAVATISGLVTYDAGGTEQYLAQCAMDTPSIQTNVASVLAYDVTGSSLCVIRQGSGVVYQPPISGSILDADLAADGALCYAAADTGSKTVLTVLDSGYNEIYRWYSETQYISQCAVSENGLYAAGIALGQVDNSFCSTAKLFRTDSEEVQAEVELGDELIYDLEFLNASDLCAVGEDRLQFFTRDGKTTEEYSYDGAYLMGYDLGGKDFAALALNADKAGTRYSLVTVGHDGKKLAELYLGKEILDISCNGSYLAVLTGDSVILYDSRLKEQAVVETSGGDSRVVVREDGSILIMGGSNGRLVTP